MGLYSPLGWAQLRKDASRVEAFLDKFDGKENFLLIDGTSVQFSKIKIGSIEYKPGSSNLRSMWTAMPSSVGTVTFIGTDNKRYGFSKIAKTSEFGGKGGKTQSSGSFSGGVITEVLSEVGFCFYFAMHVNGHLDSYNPDVWQSVDNAQKFRELCGNFSGVPLMLKYQYNDTSALNSQISKMHGFLTVAGWDPILRSQAKAFKSKYSNIGKSYFICRPSSLPEDINPYTTYSYVAEALKSFVGLQQKIDPNKWNPADFWIFSQKGLRMISSWNSKAKRLKSLKAETYSSSFMNLVNKKLISLYKSGDVYPVSLKKSSTNPRIIEVNSGRDEIEQTVEYEKVLLAPTNQDVQIFYKLKTYDNKKLVSTKNLYAKLKTKAGGFRLEIYEVGDSKARHGSIGNGLQQYIIKNTNDSGIRVLEQIRSDRRFSEIKDLFPTGGQQWLGTLKYTKLNDDAQNLLPYLNELMREVNGPGKNSEFDIGKFTNDKNLVIGTKTGAAELAVAVTKILNRNARDIVIENLHLAAGSGGINVGASLQQIKARAAYLGIDEDDLLSLGPDQKAYDALLGAGFHLKIY